MPKPRSEYPDNTRKQRASRRQAILDAAAARMKQGSWSSLESSVRFAMNGATDDLVNERLRGLFLALVDRLEPGTSEPPQDMEQIKRQYPQGRAGRPKQAEAAE